MPPTLKSITTELARELDVDPILDAEAGDDDRAALGLLSALASPPDVVGDRQVGAAGLTTTNFVSTQVHKTIPSFRG